ncbi:MAG: FumA C-terminus/TtdB family hydratase beta subunit [Defluviitaleaceae bacterium]|nr:FumA C-terminus/TtdB family hydratase beta subunit [Defluviitaleaceae bacterium]
MDLQTPLSQEVISSLRAGDSITLSGEVYTARDAAHQRMYEAVKAGQDPPFHYIGQIVFYAGPCPAPPGKPIGSVGPTTAGRMDAYSPKLIEAGLKIMIGKGNRSPKVVDAIIKHRGLYLIAVGGVAALLAKCITSSEIVAYDDLGAEAIRRLNIESMPLIVAIDSMGDKIFK